MRSSSVCLSNDQRWLKAQALGYALFVALLVYGVSAEPGWLTWMGLLMFSVGFAASLKLLFNPPWVARFDDSGVWLRNGISAAWHDIEGITVRYPKFRFLTMLWPTRLAVLEVSDTYRLSARRRYLTRQYGSPFVLPETGNDKTCEEIATLVRTFRPEVELTYLGPEAKRRVNLLKHCATISVVAGVLGGSLSALLFEPSSVSLWLLNVALIAGFGVVYAFGRWQDR